MIIPLSARPIDGDNPEGILPVTALDVGIQKGIGRAFVYLAQPAGERNGGAKQDEKVDGPVLQHGL